VNQFCIPALTTLARQIERAPTREAALDAFEQFRLTPPMMLSSDATMLVMQLISRKLVGKR
jgi:hypothetical protein